MGRLDGKVAIVTGGGRGQGRAHAVALAEEGADVTVCDVAAPIKAIKYPMATEDQLEETVALVTKHGRRAIGMVADLRQTDRVQEVVERTVSELGRVDILIANQGVVDFATVEEVTDEEWSTILDTNLTATFKAIRAVVPHMKRQRYGRIVATSSMGARTTHPNLAPYVSSKWGLIGLVKVCALETAGFGITVNALCPGAVGTDLFFNQPTYDVFCPDVEHPTVEDFQRRMDELDYGLNGRRYLDVEHVSRAVLYLVTDDGVVTGQVMEIGLGGSAQGLT